MQTDQILIVAIVVVTVAMFLWGRWRHDIVALGALLAAVAAGLVPGTAAFAGLGHPAVVTVACVLVLSHALQVSGAVDALMRNVLPAEAGKGHTVIALTGLAAALSAFMNNVGALALLMPLALQLSARLEMPPGRLLMPLAFGSILGGMVTLIGTPPNLIVAAFRAGTSNGVGFAMFDYAPVGLAVALAGIAFILLVGWRLVPVRRQAASDGFDVGAYLTEARVPKGAKAIGMTLREFENALGEVDVQIVGIVRNDVRLTAPHPARKVRADDVLVLEAGTESLMSALSALGLKLEEAVTPADGEAADAENAAARRNFTEDTELQELAVLPAARLAGLSASDVHLRTRHGLNLLAISRQGQRTHARLRRTVIRPGDVLLMQGPAESLSEFAADYGCVPLAERKLRLPDRSKVWLAVAIMGGAVALAASGLVPSAVAFAAGVLAVLASRLLAPRAAYGAIDWSVIVLLAALLPVADAIATTGTADLLARTLLDSVAGGSPVVALVLILVVTMTLSDFVNNAATAAVMCPIAAGAATRLGVSIDPFLMAVAVGASCAFLTPVGHQNNTLILGPGGFRFGDYWRLGLPLEILVVAVSVPMILLVWPL